MFLPADALHAHPDDRRHCDDGAVSCCLVPWPCLFLIGVSAAIAHTAVSAMWAGIYGVAHLGAIRSLATAIGVLASAPGPVTLATLMDHGTP